MQIGNHKIQAGGQNWFVVLNPLRSEIDRNKIAKEISKAFRIPAEEASDLVTNTPIILLDNLTYATALQIKQYFRALAASEIVVSNDTLLRRRCYRTVWPTPPSLSFLREVDPKNLPKAAEEKLEQDEAIQEIRSWVQTEDIGPDKEILFPRKNSDQGRHFKTLLEEERERLLKENVGLKDNMDQLRRALEKAQSELQTREKVLETSENEKKQKDKEVQELQTLLDHAEEKHTILKEEFRQTRQYFEEKLAVHEKKSEEFLGQIEEREIANKELMQERQTLQKSFHAIKSDILRARDEKEQAEHEWKDRVTMLTSELEMQRKVVAELQSKIGSLEEGKKIVQASEYRLMKELESQGQQTKRWELRAAELEKEIVKIRESFEGQTKSWQLRLAQLESREHELEKARKQVRDLQQQLEHRELIQRKRELSETLVLRENQLKSLVKQQEKLESEIGHREEELRRFLQEQETLERELIEIKQAQRHLAERMKREDLLRPRQEPVMPPADEFPLKSLPEASDD